jgi:hypothetical protein
MTSLSALIALLEESKEGSRELSSNWFLVAYIVPFGKYHAGKGSFRAFLVGIGIGALVFAIFFAAIYLWGG